MKTEIIKINKYNTDTTIKKASDIIKSGGVVIFPTETVYGIGANALDEKSSEKIYKAKGRPSDNPLIVHIADIIDIYKISNGIDKRTKNIISTFWPGPLTIIVKKADIIPYRTTGGLNTVAVRCPYNNIVNRIIKKSGFPIAAPSANISGKPSITSEEFIVEEFNGKVDMIILDNDSSIGIESTVIDTTEKNITILRPGYITKSDIENVIKEEVHFDFNIVDKLSSPKSPGMKYKHYSPKCDLYIISENRTNDEIRAFLKRDLENNIHSVIIAKEKYNSEFDNFISLGTDDVAVAKNIFKVLRKLDKINVPKAYFIEISNSELAFSIMDRVKKAAAYKFV